MVLSLSVHKIDFQPYEEKKACGESIDFRIEKMPCYFGNRKWRRLDISTIFLDASYGDLCFRLAEKIETLVCVFGEVDDPEVSRNADDTCDLDCYKQRSISAVSCIDQGSLTNP